MEMKRLSLNSDGALRTIMHNRTPQAKNTTSTERKQKPKNLVDDELQLKVPQVTLFILCV